MSARKRKLLTVVCESMLESDLAREIVSLGAAGYTVTDARGLPAGLITEEHLLAPLMK